MFRNISLLLVVSKLLENVMVCLEKVSSKRFYLQKRFRFALGDFNSYGRHDEYAPAFFLVAFF